MRTTQSSTLFTTQFSVLPRSPAHTPFYLFQHSIHFSLCIYICTAPILFTLALLSFWSHLPVFSSPLLPSLLPKPQMPTTSTQTKTDSLLHFCLPGPDWNTCCSGMAAHIWKKEILSSSHHSIFQIWATYMGGMPASGFTYQPATSSDQWSVGTPSFWEEKSGGLPAH